MLVWSSLISSTVNSITWLVSCCTSLFILSVVYLNLQWKVRNLWLDDLNMKWTQALACQLPSIKHGRRPSPHPPTWYPISFLPFTNTSTLFFTVKAMCVSSLTWALAHDIVWSSLPHRQWCIFNCIVKWKQVHECGSAFLLGCDFPECQNTVVTKD